MENPDPIRSDRRPESGLDQDLSMVLFWGLAATSLILSTLLVIEIW
ncbi:MAG: hypothetical protein HQM00_03085 [Magnetococcales bacterium]|nr:hypothetical protein [Magnetococcales bacterium]